MFQTGLFANPKAVFLPVSSFLTNIRRVHKPLRSSSGADSGSVPRWREGSAAAAHRAKEVTAPDAGASDAARGGRLARLGLFKQRGVAVIEVLQLQTRNLLADKPLDG